MRFSICVCVRVCKRIILLSVCMCVCVRARPRWFQCQTKFRQHLVKSYRSVKCIENKAIKVY